MKLGEHLKGFFAVTAGLVITATVIMAGLCCWRGGEMYLAEAKALKGAFSRTLGGDWRGEWTMGADQQARIDITPLDEEGQGAMMAEYEMQVYRQEQRDSKKKKKG